MEKSKLTEAKRVETGEEQSHEYAHHLSQRIGPGRPNSQFHILMWCFTAIAWKCGKTTPRTLVTKELAVASRQHRLTLPFSAGNFFYQEQHDFLPPSTLLTWLGPLWLSSAIEDKLKGRPF
jgi:hypothetical protein